MSHTNWPERGRGNFIRGSHGRGYPRYASQNNQGNEHQSHPANSQRGWSLYGEQGHGFIYYVGNEHELHPANSQRGGFFHGEQGHGFGYYYVGNGHQSHLANSQRGGFFHGEQGQLFSYGNEYQSHLANSQWVGPIYREQGRGFSCYDGNEQQSHPFNSQRGGPFYGEQGRGFSYVGNEQQSHPFNSQRGRFFNSEQGRGFSSVGNEHESQTANSQRGGSFHRERGRGFSSVGNEHQSHSTNSQRDESFNRERGHGFSSVGNEHESHPTNSQRGGSFHRERGRGFSSVGNEHQSHSTNSQRDESFNRERGHGFSSVGNEHESHPTNSQRGGSFHRERGRGFSSVGNEHESHPTNSQRSGSFHRERGRGSSSVGSEHESHPTNSQRSGSFHRERGRGSNSVGNEHESHPTNSQRSGSFHRERGRGSSSVGSEHESHPTNSQRGGSFHRERGRGSSSVGNEHESQPANSQRGRSFNRERGRGFSQRGRGQHHRGNRVHHHSQGTSRDANSSHSGHKESCRSRITTPKPTSIPGSDPHKKEEPRNKVLPKPQQKYLDFPFIEHDETVRLLPHFRVMFILRGLPGSGKSTIADAILKQCEDHAVVCSANYYHHNEDGEYVWRRDALQETHSKCQKRAEKYAALNKPVIIIDNTNVKQSEMEPYIKLAKQHGYVVVLIEPRTPWKLQARELATKNVHNVPSITISRRLEQYDEILPQYFGWFVSQADCAVLQTMAKDVLWKCLQITDFQQCIKAFSGHSSPNFTVHNALSYYSIEHSDREDVCHVTACFSPRGKYLAGSPYHKSPAVGKALGEISQVSIIGCVITNDTFSARVSLTEKQRALWMNDNQTAQQQRKRGRATRHEHSVEEMTKSFQHLPLNDNGASSERPDHCTNASTHITLGTKRDVSPIQAKYDVQTVVNYELSSHVFEEHTLQGDIGTVRKYSDSIWAVYFNEDHVVKVPVIFSGYYD